MPRSKELTLTQKTRIAISKASREIFHSCFLNPIVFRCYDRFYPAKNLGEQGERLAQRFLASRGILILETRCRDLLGEIDIVALKHQTIVFVEVKTRGDNREHPTEAIDQEKRKRITRAAKRYLKWHQLTNCSVRFDVISIFWRPENSGPELLHYESAFETEDEFQLF